MKRLIRFATILLAAFALPAFGLPKAEIHAVTNSVFDGVVTDFPVLFTGEVAKASYNKPTVSFVSPTSGTFRLSFDTFNRERVPVSISIEADYGNEKDDNTLTNVTFGASDFPVNFNRVEIALKADYHYEFTIDFGKKLPWVGNKYSYALGLDIEEVQVKFDPVNWEWGYIDFQLKDQGLNYTVGLPYAYLPSVSEDAQAEFLGWGTNEMGYAISVTNFAGDVDTLYALWSFNYCVKYISNCKPMETNYQYLVWNEPSNLRSNSFSRVGYSFANWTNELGIVYQNEACVTNLVDNPGKVYNFYAVWSNNLYQVVFTNDCPTNVIISGEMKPVTFYYDIPENLPTNEFIRAGYHLAKWYDAANKAYYDDCALVSNLTTKADGKVTLRANWAPNDYIVRFDAKGGAGIMPDQDLVYDTAAKLDTCTLSRIGYCFAGWSTSDTAETVDFADCAVVSNLTTVSYGTNFLYAVWSNDTSSTSFHLEGDSIEVSTPLKLGTATTFSGTVSPACSNVIVITNTASSSNLRISLDPQGGFRTNLCAKAFVLDGSSWNPIDTIKITDIPSNVVTMVFEKDNVYRFVIGGSNLTETYAYTLGFGLGSSQIVFDPQDGYFAGDCDWARQNLSNFNFTVGSSLGYLPEVEAEEQRFVGWFDAPQGGNAVHVEDVVSSGAKRIYAQWIPSWWYQVAYTNAADGVTGSMTNETFIYNTPQTLCSNELKRTGYIFGGWTNAASSRVFKDGEVVSNLTSRAHSTNYLFAAWDPTRYFISYQPNGGSGAMPVQKYLYGESNNLNRCTFGRFGYQFLHWTNETGKIFSDGANITTNEMYFYSEPEFTNVLSAVWTKREDITTIVEVLKSGEVFPANLGESCPYAFHGSVSNSKNISFSVVPEYDGDYRISIDPVFGSRVGATLTVSAFNGTNETVTTITDLSSKEVKHHFIAGQTNLFTVSCSSDYEFAVGIGRPGEQIVFYANGGEIVSDDASKGLTFNWTVGDPYGYMPKLASATTNGTFTGWYLRPKGDADKRESTDVVESGVRELYAGWSGRSNEKMFCFYWNHDDNNHVVTNYFSTSANEKLRNLPVPVVNDSVFIGWSTNNNPATYCEFGFAKDGYIADGDSVPTNCFVFYAQWNGDFNLESDGKDGWRIVGFNGTAQDFLNIPDQIGTKKVTEIGTNAFAGVGSTSLRVPTTVKTIQANAFVHCTEFKSVIMPLVTPLSLVFPDCYTNIVEVSNYGSSDICNYALAGCIGLEEFYVKTDVSSIGEAAFAGCIGLKSIDIPTSSEAEFLEDEFIIGPWAFSNCTELVDIQLPLGLTEINEGAFYRCIAFTDFRSMPYTVKSIGAYAFYGCTAITNIIVTEHVDEIGEYAFAECPYLKYVRYMGDKPTAAENIYNNSATGLPRAVGCYVRSGYLQTSKDWPETTERWPNDRHHLVVTAKDYHGSRYTIYYDQNNGSSEQTAISYFNGRVLGSQWGDWGPVTEPTYGWWTARRGGHQADAYDVVDANALRGTGKVTYYAHWSSGDVPTGGGDDDDEDDDDDGKDTENTGYDVEWGSDFYSDDSAFLFAKCTFDGYLYDGEAVVGKVTVKVSQGNQKKGSESAKFTASFEFTGGKKKVSLSGTIDSNAHIEMEKGDYALEADLTKSGISGTFTDAEGSYEIKGARNRYGSKDDDAKAVVKAAMIAAGGVWNVVLETESADGDGADMANGYSVLSVSIGNNGKAKITGTMADGTKVSVSSSLIVGNGCACLPVIVPLYTGKKGGFSFAIWFTWSEDMGMSIGDDDDGCSIQGLTEWDAESNKKAPFTAQFGEQPILARAIDNNCVGQGLISAEGIAELPFPEGTGLKDDLFPNGTIITMTRTKWSVPKADNVKPDKDDGWINNTEDSQNPAALKLTYTQKTGLFKGNFSVYATTAAGKSKKYTANVTGALVYSYTDDSYTGYGTATIKGIGSVPVTINLDEK